MSSHEILIALRRIMRATDLHSKRLQKKVGLTVPQLVVLQKLSESDQLSVSDIARGVSLSQGTVTSILNRLEAKRFLTRQKSDEDRRKSSVSLTETGRSQLNDAPDLLQQEFVSKFSELESWEQKMLTAAVERIASIMDAETVDASPILQVGEIVENNGKDIEPDP